VDWAVEAKDLTKRYGKTLALDRSNLKVKKDEILVLLGPNGSGKTTFLQLISTVLRPSSGTATVMGYYIVKQPLKVRQLCSISFQDPRGFWRHKPAHILSFHASMYGVQRGERRSIVEKTLKEFELYNSKDTNFMNLSGGQSKRLEVAKLFVHKPKFAIFDEPTTMVDLDGKRMIWDKILELKEQGSTIVVATNEVREAEYLADRLSIFAKGRELVTNSLEYLKDSVKGGDVVDIEFAQALGDRIIQRVRTIPGTYSVDQVGVNAIKVRVNHSEDWLPLMTDEMQPLGAKIHSIKVTEPSLDDVFLKYTRGAILEQEIVERRQS
jgi:ABC-2 type transport system ATP-binding protein